MPVPVLLNDKKNIVVAIEDNGWSGVNDFVPTTVRVALSNNWKNGFFVSGDSDQRDRSVNHNYCPVAKGGAPYLRVLPNGETVLSHQSRYGESDNMKMYVYVGNKQAKDFKAMSKPFQQGTTKSCYWNSLAVIDTGIVVAVGGLDGKIVMMKGFPMKNFMASFGTPLIDGKLSKEDRYYNSSAKQVPMGNETGTFSHADFAYDFDNLYMTCNVFRRGARSEEPFPDGINFYVDSKATSTDVPMLSSYRFDILPNGAYTVSKGNKRDWVETSMPNVSVASVVTSSAYRIEMAIPWSAIGLSEPPIGKNFSVNLEVTTGDDTQQVVERIPDASPSMPATWVLLKLTQPDPDGIGVIENEDPLTPFMGNNGQFIYDLQGRRIDNSKFKIQNSKLSSGIYIQSGKKFLF